MKRTIDFIIILSLVSMFTGCSTITGDKILQKENKTLVVQSNVSMQESNVNSQTGGQIEDIKIKEGDTVKKDQVLLTVNSESLAAKREQLKAQIETINAQLKSAYAAKDVTVAQLQEAQNGATAEDINQAKSSYELDQETYNRKKELYDFGATTKADLDDAKSELTISQNKYESLKNGTRPETIARLRAQVNQSNASVEAVQGQLKQAQASLQELQVNMNYTVIKAPTSGVVTQLNVKLGDLVSSGMPLLVITDSSDTSIMCNVRETDLSKVDLNQEVDIKIPAYKDEKFTGKVVRINKDADFAVKRATNDNGEFDVLSYGVKVEINNLKEPLRAGMTAFVDFRK